MPIFKEDSPGKFVPFEETPFEDLEKVLENWIENNPEMILEDERIAIFGRQPRTTYNKLLDLLGVDKTGATVIIELKRGETPRDVVAQTLEYAAWVDSLTLDQLDELARDYSGKRGEPAENLAELYARSFGGVDGDVTEGDDVTDRVTFNNRQRLVIVAERISNEVEQTLRYLRTRYSVDVHGVEFSVHKAGGDLIVNTTTVVGREPSKLPQTWQPQERESDEAILARVQSDFMRAAVTSIEDWVAGLGVAGLQVDHSTRSRHHLRYNGESWVFYQYAANWLRMLLYNPGDEQLAILRTRLSKPAELVAPERTNRWRFRVANEADLEVVKQIIIDRLKARGVAVA